MSRLTEAPKFGKIVKAGKIALPFVLALAARPAIAAAQGGPDPVPQQPSGCVVPGPDTQDLSQDLLCTGTGGFGNPNADEDNKRSGSSFGDETYVNLIPSGPTTTQRPSAGSGICGSEALPVVAGAAVLLAAKSRKSKTG